MKTTTTKMNQSPTPLLVVIPRAPVTLRQRRRQPQIALQNLPLFLASLLLLFLLPTQTSALVSCTSSADCVATLREGSECIDGICSNPFAQGCLRRYLGEDVFPRKRICNSHDPVDATTNGICDPPTFNYTELRILSQDWDSTMMTTWVMQIFLAEIIQMPASIETSAKSRNNNFYDPNSAFTYSTSYDYGALETSVEVGGDCINVVKANSLLDEENEEDEYRSCAHVMPEAWNGQKETMRRLESENIIDPSEGAGGVAQYGWYVPRFVAENDNSLLSHFGLRGEEGRKRLASTFNRPTNWKEYCTLVSPTNCTVPDHVASRPPETEAEEEYYHVEGGGGGEGNSSSYLYNGYFRPTADNDCESNPTTCTGHITNVVCSWSTFVVPQAHYADIAVKSDGPTVNGGYPFLRMLEIWKAANATKSPVMFYWFTPDPMLQEFVGSYSEFQRVLLPIPTQTCVENRISQAERCSEDPLDQIGSSLGACDSDAHSYQKLVSSSLFDLTRSVPEALQSPGYDAIKRFKISDLQLNDIFDYWYRRNTDRWNYDPREAVCRWVAENLEDLQRFIPRTYPRTVNISANGYSGPLSYAGVSVGVLACVLVIGTALAVYKLRDRPVMKTAQVEFIQMLLVGLLLVSVASILIAIRPTQITCITLSWLVVLGYTLELTPLIVKVAAINKLMTASRRMQRIRMSRQTLYTYVFAILFIAVVFLICWTILDPFTLQEQFVLTDDKNDQGGNIVEVSYFCGSNNDAWRYTALIWQVVLLLSATVLAIQSRNAKSEFNESQSLAFMVYSHFVFVILRVISILLESSIAANQLAGFQSFVYSVDTIATLCIYFFPKVGPAMAANRRGEGRHHRRHTPQGTAAFVAATNPFHRFLAKMSLSRASLEEYPESPHFTQSGISNPRSALTSTLGVEEMTASEGGKVYSGVDGKSGVDDTTSKLVVSFAEDLTGIGTSPADRRREEDEDDEASDHHYHDNDGGDDPETPDSHNPEEREAEDSMVTSLGYSDAQNIRNNSTHED